MRTDPPAARLLRNAKREAIVVAVIFVVAMAWTLAWCWLKGYQHAPDSWPVRFGLSSPRTRADFEMVLGMPAWVAWGIFVPWMACTAATLIFGFWFMRDDNLGSDAGEGATHAE